MRPAKRLGVAWISQSRRFVCALPSLQVVDVVQDHVNESAENGSEERADISDQILNGGNNG